MRKETRDRVRGDIENERESVRRGGETRERVGGEERQKRVR